MDLTHNPAPPQLLNYAPPSSQWRPGVAWIIALVCLTEGLSAICLASYWIAFFSGSNLLRMWPFSSSFIAGLMDLMDRMLVPATHAFLCIAAVLALVNRRVSRLLVVAAWLALGAAACQAFIRVIGYLIGEPIAYADQPSVARGLEVVFSSAEYYVERVFGIAFMLALISHIQSQRLGNAIWKLLVASAIVIASGTTAKWAVDGFEKWLAAARDLRKVSEGNLFPAIEVMGNLLNDAGSIFAGLAAAAFFILRPARRILLSAFSLAMLTGTVALTVSGGIETVLDGLGIQVASNSFLQGMGNSFFSQLIHFLEVASAMGEWLVLPIAFYVAVHRPEVQSWAAGTKATTLSTSSSPAPA